MADTLVPPHQAIVPYTANVGGGEYFKHDPLPDASTHIRLLSLDPQNATRGVASRCRLTVWKFDQAPEYHAISYTWGDERQNEDIHLNGRLKMVRKNCADVLRQISHFRTAGYYWLDFLCINQDDVSERSQQVAIMGDIFKTAGQVLACIGMEEGEDPSALRLLCDYDPFEKTGWYDVHRHSDPFISWAKSLSESEIFRLWYLCIRVQEREYFKRVWTVPEFLLAKNVACYLGFSCFPWRAVDEILRRLLCRAGHSGALVSWSWSKGAEVSVVQFANLTGLEKSQAVNHPDSFESLQQPIWLFSRREELEALLHSQSPRKSDAMLSMRYALRVVDGKHCSDPRDTIYATLPLTSAPVYFNIRPDYTRSLIDLAVITLHHDELTTEPDKLKLLSNLRLCRMAPEIQQALLERSRLVGDAGMLMPEVCPKKFSVGGYRRQTCHCGGKQLAPNSEWRLAEEPSTPQLCRVIRTSTLETVGFASGHAQTGDWIVQNPVSLEHPAHPQHHLVVRAVGDVFAIVGLAHIPEWNIESRFSTELGTHSEFDVHFDLTDYVIYIASMLVDAEAGSDEEKFAFMCERLNARFCSSPCSSFAELSVPGRLSFISNPYSPSKMLVTKDVEPINLPDIESDICDAPFVTEDPLPTSSPP